MQGLNGVIIISMAEVSLGLESRIEKFSSPKEHIYSVADSTTAERFGKEYPGGGLEEFTALSRLFRADPSHVARPLSLIKDKSDQVVGYKAEKVDGKTVDQYMLLHGRLSRKYVNQITEALHIFHNEGLVHGDVNPHNIIISKEGIIKFIDPVGYSEIKKEELPQYVEDDWRQLKSWLQEKRNTILSRILR